MPLKINPLLLTLSIIITTAAGFLLKYLELDTYFILLGFRFHISSLLPLLFIIKYLSAPLIKQFFVNPVYKNNLTPLIWIFIPLIFSAGLYFSGFIDLADPEYFYEFGLSSIIDYPIYLLWNFINLGALFIFLSLASRKIMSAAVFIIFLFLFEFIPLDLESFNIPGIAAFLLLSISAAVYIRYFSNIYWFVISYFSILWSLFLLYGSSSATAVNIFFASRYRSWEGFIEVPDTYSDYIIPVHILIFFLAVCIPVLFTKREHTKYK